MEIKNELIWSTSRISLFYECPRKYYYNYYGYWEGWLPRANEDQKELYLLKNLKNIQTLTGELVHDLISSYLKSIKNGSSELDIKDIFEKKFDHLINISTKKLYRRRPKLGGIIEHEYDIDLPQELIDEQREKGKKCLDMFLKSKHLKKILSIPSKQWIFSPNFCKCEIGAFEAYTLFDFAYEEEGKTIIIDFKTGNQAYFEDSVQPQAYIYYFWKTHNKKPEDMTFLFWHLPSDELIRKNVNEETLHEFETLVKKDILTLQKQLDNVEKNIASEEKFNKTHEIVYCRNCQFRRYCNKSNHKDLASQD